jgi:predicted anti-sigma-YlaC factor YlaD
VSENGQTDHVRVLTGLRRRERVRCQQAVELLTDYLEGALSPRAQARLDKHLRTCDACRAYLDQLRATISVLGQARLQPPDPAVRAELIELYQRYHTESG